MSSLNRSTAGFSLVEIMVAMTIGLITAMVVGQVMQATESRKRVTSSGGDAATNAALALYSIESDGRNAGYGIVTSKNILNCPVQASFSGANVNFSLAPVTVVEGANGAPDQVQLRASNRAGAAFPTRVAVDHPQQAANFFVDSTLGMSENDLVVAVPEAVIPGTNWCSIFQVTGLGGARPQVIHNPGQSNWNPPGGQSIFPPGGYNAGSYLINLGTFQDNGYRVSNGFLQLLQFNSQTNTTTTLNLYPNIVQLQAVYGRDTNADNVVDTWDTTNSPATILALRVAVVARSQALEPGVVTLNGNDATSPCNAANPHPAAVCWRPNPNGNGVTINVNTDGTNPNWQSYRYRVMETTIPLRNVIWN